MRRAAATTRPRRRRAGWRRGRTTARPVRGALIEVWQRSAWRPHRRGAVAAYRGGDARRAIRSVPAVAADDAVARRAPAMPVVRRSGRVLRHLVQDAGPL